MNKIINNKYVVIIAVLLLGFTFGWLVKPAHDHGDAVAERSDTASPTEDQQLWTCSMHPQIRKTEPGDCPICGMELIPLESADQGIDPNAITMSATAMKLASVRTAKVGRMEPERTVRLDGKVQQNERRVYSQSSHIPGRVEKLMIDFTGEYVQKGQVIAYVYSPDLVTAQEELFEAQSMQTTQPALFESAKEKLKNWKLSDRQVHKILDEGKVQEQFPITADVSGIVTQKLVHPGDYLKRGQSLYEVSDLSTVWVLFDVYESDLPWVHKGDEVTFTVSSLPGASFEGKISFIDPVIDPKTRVAQARVEMMNKNLQLKPEMFVSGAVSARLTRYEDAITIPKSAVLWTGKRSIVYVKKESEQGVQFIMREIVLGPGLGDQYLVEEGLNEGEQIAVSGTFSIDAAAQLAGKPCMMNPEAGVDTSDSREDSVQEALPISNEAKVMLSPLYKAYLKWKNALVADDAAQAKTSLSDMKKAIDQVEMEKFKGEAHKKWMMFSKKLNKILGEAENIDEIGDLRRRFQAASAVMINMTATFNPFDQALYVEFCPMANDNKGASWLSLEEKIANPYFGAAMLSCGEVTSVYK